MLTVIAALHAAHINQRDIRVFECLLEYFRFVHEVQLLERLCRQHYLVYARNVQRRFEPPEGLHRHVMRERLVRHGAAENGHRRAADSTAGENDTVYFMLRDFFRHLNTFFEADAFPAVIPHIGLDHYRDVLAGMRHDLVQHFVHKPYAVLERAAVLVAAVVRTRRDELRQQIRMSGVYFHAVEPALTRPIDCLAEFLDEMVNLLHFEATVNGRRVEVKPCVGTDGHTMTGIEMRHVTAVTELDRCFRALFMDGVGHLLHIGNYLRTHVELSVERHTTQVHRAVRNGRHTYSTASDGYMIVL